MTQQIEHTLDQTAINEVDKVMNKLLTLAKNCDTPSPLHGRNVAKALRELHDELEMAIYG